MALNGSQEKCDVLQQASDGVEALWDWGERGPCLSLGEAGVGAARVAVFPLPALHYAGDLQARHH